MKGEVFQIATDGRLSDYAAPWHLPFPGYSQDERSRILATFAAPPRNPDRLFFQLDDEAAHYVELRAEFDLRKQKVQERRAAHLSRLADALDLLLEAERDLKRPDMDLMHQLEQRRVRVEMQRATLDPFNSADGYIPQLRLFGICDPSPEKDRQPEHSFAGALCKVFAQATGIAVTDVTITNIVQKNPFMRFAWACVGPLNSGHFTPEAIAGAARAYKNGKLESAALYAR